MEIFAIRRKRLKQIIKDDFNGNQAAFSRESGIKSPQINRWLSETAADRRNITERSARTIEQKAKKPAGWLDKSEPKENRAEQPIVDYTAQAAPKSQRDKDIEELLQIAKTLDPTGLGMLLQSGRQIAKERPAAKTA